MAINIDKYNQGGLRACNMLDIYPLTGLLGWDKLTSDC